MDDDLRKELARLQKKAAEVARAVSDEGHFPSAQAARLLQEITQALAEVAARCPKMHGKD
jgi:hypothetical protein